MTMIPAQHFNFLWGEDVLVIPEYSFGVDTKDFEIKISDEHKEFKWVTYEEANDFLIWDSNKTTIWELSYRLEKR